MDRSAVGVIGLGNMGRGIAANLGKADQDVFVWDLAEAARARFKDRAGFIIAPPNEMARHCQAIFFLVPATPEIKACLEGGNGIVANAREGLILCDLTTSDPLATRALAEELSAHGIHYIDAGTSGGPTRADSGELTLMVGGDAGAFERVKPFLNDIAKTIYYLGASGTGHTMKLLHNVVCHATFFATTEAFRLGERAGLKLDDMVEVLNNSNARSYVTEFALSQAHPVEEMGRTLAHFQHAQGYQDGRRTWAPHGRRHRVFRSDATLSRQSGSPRHGGGRLHADLSRFRGDQRDGRRRAGHRQARRRRMTWLPEAST